MVLLGIVLLLLLACFSFVLIFGPPYLPTLRKQVEIALDMADLKPGQTLLELGCGDGKVLVAAAKRGYRVVGYELNPLLVVICWLRTLRYRQLVKVQWGNFLTQDWPQAEAIFVFGLKRIMPQLDKKIVRFARQPVSPASTRGSRVKLVSFAFQIPGRKVAKTQAGLFLYHY